MKESDIPDIGYYEKGPYGTFRPWGLPGEFSDAFRKMDVYTAVNTDRLYVLWCTAKSLQDMPGEVWECGVYKGGSARMIFSALPDKTIRLFDTFEGIPNASKEEDCHHNGDFSDTSMKEMGPLLEKENVHFHEGLIPETFIGLKDSEIAMAHVDVDVYQSVLDCCWFIWPRLRHGGVMVFDDYGFKTCPGARKAVDEYFKDKKAVPLVLANGQAIVTKNIEGD